jgi:hypothetical protein
MDSDITVGPCRIVVEMDSKRPAFGGGERTPVELFARAVRGTLRAQEVTTEQLVAALAALDERLGQ